MLTHLQLENFTVFKKLNMEFSPGINVFIGKNGTGKTHIMKLLYSACCVADKQEDKSLTQKLRSVFLPNTIGRLVHRAQGRGRAKISVYRKDESDDKERALFCSITTVNKVDVTYKLWQTDKRASATFIPVKDMLANAPGFRSLYASKSIQFEEVYADIIDKALLPAARGKQSTDREKLIKILSQALSGNVIEKNEHFYLRNKNGELEFPLLAEGYRKLGLLYTLIKNETLVKGSVLFWDEPEANLNPSLAATVVKILNELQKMGVQIFIATHDFVLLKEFDLLCNDVNYYSLYLDQNLGALFNKTDNFDDLLPNSIDEAYQSLLDQEIVKQLKSL